MASLAHKVREYLKSQGKSEIETDEIFNSAEVRVEDDGSGAVLGHWDVSGITQPTDEQLTALESQTNTYESNRLVISTRKKLYGSTAEQLEYIVENGVDAFVTRQQQIKTDNPKS